MALDSRLRPVRRPARRRVARIRSSSLTALTLLVMAAGLWFAGPATASVPAPRLQVAESQIAAAESAVHEEPAPHGERAQVEAPRPDVTSAAGSAVAVPVVAPVAAFAAAVEPAVAGPRGPPHS